jgi:SAM-dependent methyltransferase
LASDRYTITPLVLVGIPTLEKRPISWEWMQNQYQVSFPLGSSHTRLFAAGMYVDDARNALVEKALAINAEYVLFISDDVHVPSNVFTQLWRHKVPIATGVYWDKNYPTFPYLWRGMLKGPYEDWKVGEYFEVDVAGCDCLLIHTDVFRAIEKPWFSRDWVFEPEQGKPSDIATEDFYFFTKARAAGFKTMCDSMVQCFHEDRHTSTLFGLQPGMPQTIMDDTTVEPGTLLVADLGAGRTSPVFAGASKVIRFDAREDVYPDVRCDLRAIPHNHFGQYDLVHSRHVLEHFAAAEAMPLVKHWGQLVKVGGELRICIPDIQCAMEDIVRGEELGIPTDNYSWDQLYGAQQYDLDFHKNGFTRRALANLLATIPNFGNVEVERNTEERNLYGRATRLRADEPYALGPVWREVAEREAAPVDSATIGGETNGHELTGDLALVGANYIMSKDPNAFRPGGVLNRVRTKASDD